MQALLFTPYVAILASLLLTVIVVVVYASQPVRCQAVGFDAKLKNVRRSRSGRRMRSGKPAWLSSRRAVTSGFPTAAVR
jgi:hypothetical protein